MHCFFGPYAATWKTLYKVQGIIPAFGTRANVRGVLFSVKNPVIRDVTRDGIYTVRKRGTIEVAMHVRRQYILIDLVPRGGWLSRQCRRVFICIPPISRPLAGVAGRRYVEQTVARAATLSVLSVFLYSSHLFYPQSFTSRSCHSFQLVRTRQASKV